MKLSIKQKIRFLFRGSMTFISYGLTISFLFHNNELLLSLVTIFTFFIAFHFFYFEIYKFHRKYLTITLIFGVIITGIITTPQTTAMRIANIGLHTTIGILAYNLYQETEGRIGFDSLGYFSIGGYLFTMILALVYSTVIVNFFSEFPMNCQQLNQQSGKIISTITKPFKISREETQKISNSSKTFFSSTFGDVFEASKDIKITTSNREIPIITKLKNRKENLITKTIQENKKLNDTICDYTLNLINEKLQSPTIQYPVIVLIIFLIYPFLRIIIRIFSIIGFLIFELLYLLKLYTKHKEKREVERIE